MSGNDIFYTLQVNMGRGDFDLRNTTVLRMFEIIDRNFKKIDHKWVRENTVTFERLPAGIFLVRVMIGGELWGEQVVTNEAIFYQQIDISQQVVVDENDYNTNAENSRTGDKLKVLWIEDYLIGFAPGPLKRYPSYKICRVTFLEFRQGQWHDYRDAKELGGPVRIVPSKSSIEFPKGLFALVLNYRDEGTKLVVVPPGKNLLSLSSNKGPVDVVHPIKVNFTLGNRIASTLASLLDKNDIQCADNLMSAFNARDLLQDKRKDHVSAAIGGYYLLKVNRLDMMHDWGRNLSNWFPWMADGAIIYAWQMLKGSNSLELLNDIIQQLVDAVRRGLPIFTEGLRLLYEGILQVTDYQKANHLVVSAELKAAKEKVRQYVQYVDWSQQYTTIINFLPTERSDNWHKVTIDDMLPLNSSTPVVIKTR